MSERILNGDTVALLKECDSGCKMATESMEQISQMVKNQDMVEILIRYNQEHIRLGEEIHQYLNSAGEEAKDPNPMAKAFSWLQSEVKMMMKGDSHQAASLLIDGCNMGIKSLNEYKNKYTDADEKSVSFCERLIGMEKELMAELEKYL